MSTKKKAAKKNAAKKNSSNDLKVKVAMMEKPPFKRNPWAVYKWVLDTPIETGEERSKQNAQDEVEAEYSKIRGHENYTPEFYWVVNRDGLTYRLKVKLKPVGPPSDGSKSPQPPPPPPEFP